MNISIVDFFHTHTTYSQNARELRTFAFWLAKSTQCYRLSSPISLEVGIWPRPLVPLWKYSRKSSPSWHAAELWCLPKTNCVAPLGPHSQIKTLKNVQRTGRLSFLVQTTGILHFPKFWRNWKFTRASEMRKDLWLLFLFAACLPHASQQEKKRSPLGSPKIP